MLLDEESGKGRSREASSLGDGCVGGLTRDVAADGVDSHS